MTTVPLETDILLKVVDFPDQVANALRLSKEIMITMPAFKEKISQIVILGMGGSGIAGDFTRILLRHLNVPVHVCKNPIPPRFLTSDTLVIAVTYSGNTHETLDALSAAMSIGSKVVLITSAAELVSTWNAKNVHTILIPKNDYPRASLGYLLIPLLTVLHKAGFISISDHDYSEALSVLHELREQCHPTVPVETNPARLLALALVDKFPVIYGETGFTDVVALRWKQLLNENSKVHCYCDSFPELLHNEIEVWYSKRQDANQNKVLLILRDIVHELDSNVVERVEATKDLVESRGAKVFELWTKGKSELARLLSLSYLADFVSVYLALHNGINPSTIPNIEQLKKQRLAPIKRGMTSER